MSSAQASSMDLLHRPGRRILAGRLSWCHTRGSAPFTEELRAMMPAIIFSHQVPFDIGWPTNWELCVSTALAKFSDTATSTTREAGRKNSSGIDRAHLSQSAPLHHHFLFVFTVLCFEVGTEICTSFCSTAHIGAVVPAAEVSEFQVNACRLPISCFGTIHWHPGRVQPACCTPYAVAVRRVEMAVLKHVVRN